MSNYNSLKTTIDANIKQNGNQEITGQILNSVLNAMVTTLGTGYQFAGVATIATNPGTPDAKVFYIANGKGTYEKFGGLEVTEDDVVVFYWDSSWHKVATGIASQEKLSELESNAVLYPNLIRSDIQYYKKYIKKGSIYQGIIANSNDCLYIDKYFYCKNVHCLLCNSKPRIRLTFYDANKNYISDTGTYAIVDCINIPNNVYWYKVSMAYDGYSSENPISPNDYTDGDFFVKNLVLYTDSLPKCDSDYLITSGAVEKVAGSDVDMSSLLRAGYDDRTKWMTTNIDYKGVCIDCSDGDRFIITCGEHFSFYSFLTSAPLTDTSPVPRVEGTTRVQINAGETKYIVAPAGTKYLYIATLYGGSDITPIKVTRCTKFLGVIDNCDMDSADYPLSARQGMMLGLKPSNYINIKYFALLSYYQGGPDTSSKKIISTRDRFYYVRSLKKVSYSAKLGDTPYTTRVTFYDDSHTYISQTSYSDVSYVDVPINATYCKFSFNFSKRDTDIDLNELVQGNFATNAEEEDYQGKFNNGSTILAPISKGYINFDNTAKKIVVNGSIGILYNHTMTYINSGTEIEYPNNLTPASGTYFYLVYNGNELSIKIANTTYNNIIELEKCSIVACIWIDTKQTIRKDNISFSMIPYKIDDDKIYDLEKLKEFSSHLISDNPVDTFLFFTDPHLQNSAFIDFAKSEVMQNIENYYKRAALAKCISGGDWMNQFTDDNLGAAAMGNVYGYCYSVFHDFLPIQGNHDYNTYTQKPPLSNQTTVNIMMQKYGKNYYYEDNIVSRYYIFDSGYDTYTIVATTYQYEQVNWVANLLLNSNKEHSVFFIHQAIIGGNAPDYVYSGFITQLTILANAYNNKQAVTINGITYDFSNVEGTVHCVIAGHYHQDVNTVLNNIPVVITINAQKGFDLCAIDYDSKKLYMTRIGVGNSRTIDII